MGTQNKNEFHEFESYQPSSEKLERIKGKKFASINAWLKQHKKTVLLFVVAIAALLGAMLAYLFSTLQYGGGFSPFSPKPVAKIYSPLTGVEVSKEDSQRPVTAVMIENSPDARPQSGLKECGVTFEAIAEAGITRFLCLYQEAQPELIGPVRSLRPYYLDWLAAFDPTVAHVGGSLNSLNEVRGGSYKDLDQYFNAETYWRTKDRRAPHNVYTNSKNLNAANETKNYKQSVFTGFAHKDDTPSKAPDANTVTVPVSSALFNSSYQYSPNGNFYLRSQAGKPHLDREKGQVSPKVIVVIQTTHGNTIEDGARETIQTIGTGKATIFQDGTVTSATWSKKSKTDQIHFLDVSGKEVPLNRGQTWVTATPINNLVSWK